MRFRFIGDPANKFDGPDELTKFDHSFSRFSWTDVRDPWVIAKLSGNAHFEAAADDISTDGGDPREALIAEAEGLGIDVDRRWSNATLERKIGEARA